MSAIDWDAVNQPVAASAVPYRIEINGTSTSTPSQAAPEAAPAPASQPAAAAPADTPQTSDASIDWNAVNSIAKATPIPDDVQRALDKKSMGLDVAGVKGTGSATIDAANAFGTGFNRAALRLAGIGVDTLANVRDLAKAAVGAPYIAVTGKAPPDFLQIGNRANDVGSGDNLIRSAEQTQSGQSALIPSNPDYEGGYIQAAGGVPLAIANPKTRLQALNQGVLGLTSILGSKAVGDVTGNPALAIAASMLPGASQQAAVAGTKFAVRGGEAGRVNMGQRVADLSAAGIDRPTLGLASGNSQINGMENILQNTPGAVNVMRNARESVLNGMQAKVDAAAAAASPIRGALQSGTAIQSGIRDFRDNFKTQQAGLYDKLDQFVAPGTPSGVTSTMDMLAKLNAPIPGAPNTSKLFRNARIGGIEEALGADLTQPQFYSPSQLQAAAAQNPQNATALNGLLGEGKLPYEAVKKTRTLVGNEIADNSLTSDVPRSKWNPLYGALSEDLQSIAAKSGPQATTAFNRATDFTRAGIQRLDRLDPFASAVAPEQAFTTLKNTLGENVSTLQAVKKSLPEGARGTVAGTVIERLGKATNGNQNDVGNTWSPETFLTNWNKMKPDARNELFSGFPNSAQVNADVSSVARAASMMRDGSKLWANPSGTAANLGARATLGALTLGGAGATAGLLSPLVPLAAGAGLLGTNFLSKRLTSQGTIDAMTRRNVVSPELTQAQINAMIGGGLLGQ